MDITSIAKSIVASIFTYFFRYAPISLKKWIIGGRVPGDTEIHQNAHHFLDIDQQIILKGSRAKPIPKDFPSVAYLPRSRASMSNDTFLIAGPVPTMAAVSDISMKDFRGSNTTVTGRLYVPKRDHGGMMLYFHGGGWAQGSVASHEGLCQMLADAMDMRVLSTEYRLAPEHPYPIPLEDCWIAYQYSYGLKKQQGSAFGPLVLAGDSAGGNLAAAIARRAMQHSQPADAQLLIYPVTDLAVDRASRTTYANGFLLTRKSMDFYQQCYAPLESCDRTDPDISPIYASKSDMSKLPPTLVVTAGYDPLVDEGKAYAQKLEEAGVRTKLMNFEGSIHGFMNFGCTTGTQQSILQVTKTLRELIETNK